LFFTHFAPDIGREPLLPSSDRLPCFHPRSIRTGSWMSIKGRLGPLRDISHMWTTASCAPRNIAGICMDRTDPAVVGQVRCGLVFLYFRGIVHDCHISSVATGALGSAQGIPAGLIGTSFSMHRSSLAQTRPSSLWAIDPSAISIPSGLIVCLLFARREFAATF
jgi:hypothetical protein